MSASLNSEAAQRRQFEALLAKLQPDIAKAFREVIRRRASDVDFGALVQAIKDNRLQDAIDLVAMRPRDVFTLTEAVRSAYIAGGQSVAIGQFGFDGMNLWAVAWAAQKAAALVTSITEESRQSAQAIIVDAVTNPRGPVSVAVDLVGRKIGTVRQGGVIGLTSTLTDSINRGRMLLNINPRKYLALKLRDKRFDRLIAKAIRDKRRLTPGEINKIIAGHTSKALAYRGKVVAATETHQALAAGQFETYRQMIETGFAEGVSKKWVHGLSRDARHNHVALDGTRIDFEERFDLGGGIYALHPHDAILPPSETIGCRCSTVFRLVLPKG